MENITVEFRPDRVANLLKNIINTLCEEGEGWYEDVGEMPTVFDMTEAIRVLEEAKIGSIKIVCDEA